ncbi:gamma-glutamylcyclotransferase family protein [Falsiroseomonas sp.]|uniref:gamma-glutamylcyclotransferase family protein n=1 Tax=Falsiroseomonas sp. TaxID=2870721 RepID=UPI002720D7BE|nr:gamma-glutamylcyclotransferase family protein [Falsiroseomonas sp.]MDO9502072.1 gamma-glutamylcyclotransferase family protein [Falsiroseomonas sp.]
MPLLYAAYGSNLDHARMRERCEGAEPAGTALLPGWRLVLRRYADIEPDAASLLPIGLWRIRPRHLRSLDKFEGTALGIYERLKVALPEGGEAWIYAGRRLRAGPPEGWYVGHLRLGYREFGLEPGPLDAALSACGFTG